MKRTRHLRLIVFLWPLWTAGCSLPEPPELVAISSPPVFRPKAPQEIKTLEEAMGAIINITGRELGLPVVDPLYIHLHKTTDSYAAYSGGAGRLDYNMVQFSVALAQGSRFHVNMEKTKGRPWSALVKTLAHEYAHNIENSLSIVKGPQWFREGFAEWVSAKVIHSLGWQDYALFVHRAEMEVRRLKSSLPALSDLEKNERWAVWANDPKGAIWTYRLAFLAVDKLMEQKGIDGTIAYIKSHDFKGSFGLSSKEFEESFTRSLAEPGSSTAGGLKSERPEWKIGDRWRYAVREPGRRAVLAREVTGEEPFEGMPVYVMRVGQSESLYSREVLGVVATRAKGKLTIKRTVPYQLLSWPMGVKREWRVSFNQENVQQKSSQTFDNVVAVPRVEEVKTPAGTFAAFKIEVFGFQNGGLSEEYWYAPEVRWFVKTRIYLANGVREEELMNFTRGTGKNLPVAEDLLEGAQP